MSATTYWSRTGTLKLSEVEDRLTYVESLAYGLKIACENRLAVKGKTMEEEGLVTLLGLGIQKILDEIGEVIPDINADIRTRKGAA